MKYYARIKSSILFFNLSLFMLLSAGKVGGSCIDVINPVHLLPKVGIQENSRKLMGFQNVFDYDYAGANPKHQSRGKRGGGGSKNP